jgi:predicted amidohydrolase YtcJ
MSGTGADIVFVNGPVFTADAAGRWARAVAVAEGRIVAVGSETEMRPFVGSRTELVDLAGRLLLPGIQDAHVHPPSGGLDRLRVDLSGVGSLAEYRAAISAYALGHPEAAWILGGGWAMGAFPGGTPTAEMLDAVVPDRPAFISNRDNHGAWVNTRALELAGITEGSPDPPDGRIERDELGRPTGTLHEGAMRLVRRLVPPVAREDQVQGLLLAQSYLHSLGITAWQDAIVGDYETFEDSYETYRDLDGNGRLTARVVGALWWRRDAGLEQIEELRERRSQDGPGRFRATSVKLMVDGVAENFTGAMLEPYVGAEGTGAKGRGISFIPRERLLEAVPALDAAGFQPHFHVVGDRACRDALDAVEAARRANGWTDTRPHLAHLQVVHPDDRPRFRRLGAAATFQPLWAAHEPQMDELTIPFLGPERSTWQYPIGSLAAQGATLAMGSDWPVSSPDPFWEIHVAVNREMPPGYPYGMGATGDPFLPKERIDLATALRAFTIGSAYVNHLDDVSGSIEVGKAADLIVLDRDPFETAPAGIAGTKVLLTLVDGRPVHDARGL